MLVMGKSVYTPEQKDFIRKYYPENGAEWVAEKLHVRKTCIKSFVINNKIHRTTYHMTSIDAQFIRDKIGQLSFEEIANCINKSANQVKGFAYRQKLRPNPGVPFSKEHTQFIRENYHELSNTEIASIIGRSADSIKHKMRILKLSRTKEELLAINTRLCSDTWLKKGNIPQNTKYDGYTSTRIDSHGHPYQYIRIKKGIMVQLHRYNWEQVNGPIPDGMILRSKDGDSSNCYPDNWKLVDRAEHLGENSGRDELTDNYVLAKLTHRHKELKPAFAEMPELIELKRNQIKLKRTINELTEITTNGQ